MSLWSSGREDQDHMKRTERVHHSLKPLPFDSATQMDDLDPNSKLAVAFMTKYTRDL